jgi:orotidine-5'-phosphate decarboxylase
VEDFVNYPWLTPWEQAGVIERLIAFNAELIKWDNGRSLPLKNGGKTDIYINIRNARNCPEAIKFLAEVYRNPLLRLGVDRFVEVPDSVSCFAGQLSVLINIPYLTIRKEGKENRVAKSKVIGDAAPNSRGAIIDDVITDGASKIGPISECLKMGIGLAPLIVLVDRKQGWQKNFQERGIGFQVWPGMTLHDVRRHLIFNGLMQKCKPEIEEKNPIVVALDGKNWEEVLSIIDPLRTTGCILKVNDFLFEKGMGLISDLQVYGRVLADLKGHDIPNTVRNTCRRLAKYNPWGVTIHCSGQEEMIRVAVEEFRNTDTKVFGVTLLTSIRNGCEEVYVRRHSDEVIALAKIAKRAGAHGLVCAGDELGELRRICPKQEFLVPAIRSPKTVIKNDDQARISTPEGVLAMGANYMVLGRQVTTSEDPVGEVMRVLNEEIKI